MSDKETTRRKPRMLRNWERRVETRRQKLGEGAARYEREALEVRRVRWCIPEEAALAVSVAFLNQAVVPMARGHFEEFTFANADPAKGVAGIDYRLYDGMGNEIPASDGPGTAPPLQGTWDRPVGADAGPVKIEVTVADPSWTFAWAIPFENLFDPEQGTGWWIHKADVGFAFRDACVPFAHFRLLNGEGESAIVVAESLPQL